MASSQQPSTSNQNTTEKEKDKDLRWYFTAEQLAKSPTTQCKISAEKELLYRQHAANLIQCMGQQLHVYVIFIMFFLV